MALPLLVDLCFAISTSGAGASRPRCWIPSTELEMSRVKGAGIPTFSTAGMSSLDEALGKLHSRHPHVRRHTGILGRVLRLQPRLTYTHRLERLLSARVVTFSSNTIPSAPERSTPARAISHAPQLVH